MGAGDPDLNGKEQTLKKSEKHHNLTKDSNLVPREEVYFLCQQLFGILIAWCEGLLE